MTRNNSRMFNHDYAAMLALSDERKAETRAAQAAALANRELTAMLSEQARWRGETGIVWLRQDRGLT